MTIFQLITVREAAKFGAYLAAVADGRRVMVDFGVLVHAHMEVADLREADQEALADLDELYVAEFTLTSLDDVFLRMEEIVKKVDDLDLGRTFFFEGYSTFNHPGGIHVITLRWGS